ncbi:hypothetical protein [Aureibaculum conchae]|uniref:hypothetical protein n=1 Tax=Aureibaculum sp. 2308TA14-22 TaxID=3108392 RepID=UPI003399FFB4
MKHVLYVLAFTFSLNILSQGDNSAINTLKLENSQQEGGLVGSIEKTPKEISGSYHLFKGWNNHGLIHAKNDKYYKIKNINFNIKNNFFEYKNDKDSIVGFDLNGSEILVNSKRFKSFHFNKTNDDKIFEIIWDNDLFILLKDYSTEVKKIKPEGYKDFSSDKYIVRKTYYLIKDNKIGKFKLSKKNVLGLLKLNSESIEKYVKQNKLSYKKDKDLKIIFDYYNSL